MKRTSVVLLSLTLLLTSGGTYAARAASGGGLTAAWDDGNVIVSQDGVVLAHELFSDPNDPTLAESSGRTLDGTSFTVQVYRMLDPGESPPYPGPGEDSDPTVVEFVGDAAMPSFEEELQSGSPYEETDLIDVAGVVTSPSETILLAGTAFTATPPTGSTDPLPGPGPGPGEPAISVYSGDE